MATKADQTKAKILEVSEKIILQKGFSGTSLDEIIADAGITKGGFFYHFKGKSDLAIKLVEQYLETDEIFFNDLFDRASSLVDDPLQRMLVFLKLLSEAFSNLPDVHPGCLVASFTYESQVMDPRVKELNAVGLLAWRKLFAKHLHEVADTYKMKVEVEIDDLAEMLTCIIEGAIISSRVFEDPKILVAQILQYRNYIKLIFFN